MRLSKIKAERRPYFLPGTPKKRDTLWSKNRDAIPVPISLEALSLFLWKPCPYFSGSPVPIFSEEQGQGERLQPEENQY
jgi:hypothetical protein